MTAALGALGTVLSIATQLEKPFCFKEAVTPAVPQQISSTTMSPKELGSQAAPLLDSHSVFRGVGISEACASL